MSASTQSQTLQALLFLYRLVLEIELTWLDNVTRANWPRRLPVVPTRNEVRAILDQLQGAYRLIASMLHGAGLRLHEWRNNDGMVSLEFLCHMHSARNTATPRLHGIGNTLFPLASCVVTHMAAA